MSSNASVTEQERFDTEKAIVPMNTGRPAELESYHMLQQVAAWGTDDRRWYRELHLLQGKGRFVIADWTYEKGIQVWFLDGPMDLEEAYRKAPYCFPPCFRPIGDSDDT